MYGYYSKKPNALKLEILNMLIKRDLLESIVATNARKVCLISCVLLLIMLV